MTDAATPSTTPGNPASKKGSLLVTDARTKKRNNAEKRFRAYGITAISVGVIFLATLLYSIVGNGAGAFTQTFIAVDIALPEETLDPEGNRDRSEMSRVSTFGYNPLIQQALAEKIASVLSLTHLTGSL